MMRGESAAIVFGALTFSVAYSVYRARESAAKENELEKKRREASEERAKRNAEKRAVRGY
jgi:hypothetical protein